MLAIEQNLGDTVSTCLVAVQITNRAKLHADAQVDEAHYSYRLSSIQALKKMCKGIST